MSTLKVNEIQKNTSASITLGDDVTTDNDLIMTSNAVLDVDAASSAALPASTTIGTNVTVSSANGIVCTGDVKGDELKIGDNRTMSSAVPRVGGVLTFTANWSANDATITVSNLGITSGTSFGVDSVSIVAHGAAANSGIRVSFTSAVQSEGDNAKGIVMVRTNPGSTNPNEDDFFWRTVITDSQVDLLPTNKTDHGHAGTNKAVECHFIVISPN